MPASTSPESTDCITTRLFCTITPLSSRPASQSAVASSPSSSRTADTIAWKSAPVGEKATRPFHSGSAKSRIEAGMSASVIVSVLYIATVERARKPVHVRSDGTYSSGIEAVAASGSSANSPALSTMLIAGEFSVRNTSAGESSPSSTIWLAISRSLPLRSSTSRPDSSSNNGTISSRSSSCWAL